MPAPPVIADLVERFDQQLEAFAVYDCRVEPRLDDKASVARILYLNFHEYVSRWDDIAKIFEREAILKGSFDKFAESTKAKRGTAEVDDAFLSEIERWRADLARNLALRNPALSQRDLNFSVQRTIDRIEFSCASVKIAALEDMGDCKR